MSISHLIRFLRRILTRLTTAPPSPNRQLRLTQLEERRVLNAALGLNGIDLSGGETLTISDGGMVDVGAGIVQTVDLTLTNGTWTSIDGGINVNDYELDGTNRILTIDASLIQDGGDVLNVSDILEIRGSAPETDHVVIDLSGIDPNDWNPISSGGISFIAGEDGGNLDNDSLTVTGYSLVDADNDAFSPDVHLNYSGPESGTIILADFGTITFAEIEPLTLSGTAADMVIDLPNSVDNNVVLSDDGDGGNLMSRLDGDSFEQTDFANPTNSLTINDLGLAKQIFVRGLDPGFDADVIINDDTNDNSVTFDTNDTDLGSGDLTITADTITINRAISTAGGNITFNVDTLISSDANGVITTTAAADSGLASGFINLDASATGTINLQGDLITAGADHSAGNGSDGGAVTLHTTNGTIAAGLINTSGGDDLAASNTGGAAGSILINTGSSNLITLRGALTAAGGTGNTAGAGANVTLSDAVVLATDISIDTGATAGNVTFSSTIEGTTAEQEDLTITAGTGDVFFNNAVGATTRLGVIDINSNHNLTAAALTIAALNQDAGTGATTLNGSVNVTTNAANGGNDAVKITAAGIVTIGGTITATANPGLNIDIDPIDVAVNFGISATGDIDITASNDITVGAVTVRADTDGIGGGTLNITADDDNSGAGDL
ncbi:MAG: hypothetical protein KDA85_12860, partial [Planctomycetaceae bacterium]|nr:hypothetical protein [Planctomycetaceae bacterium]